MKKSGRKLVVGDIHGGLIALEKLLETVKYNNKLDTLIFLGDYIDGWSDSAQLIEYLINLEEEALNKPIFILGNHDDEFMFWLETGKHAWGWQQGARATIESYGRLLGLEVELKPLHKLSESLAKGAQETFTVKGITPDDIPHSHKAFLKRLRLYYYDQQTSAVFVHGGFNNKMSIAGQESEHIFFWDRDLVSEAIACELSKNTTMKFVDNIREVFVGHTPTLNWGVSTPITADRVTLMDTGAGHGGRLCIMDIKTKKYWLSEKLNNLYPMEKGR